ncbi:MAG: putative glutamine amidotransferase [Nocardioidaceae bacterium]|nr:putative glutamine amidotransferase [Nocardioidaceae bacterium]
MSRRPVIGITSYVEPASWSSWRDVPAALVPHAYVRQVSAAGGLALVVPPLPQDATEADARNVLSRMEGLIIAGGADVQPSRYGQQPHPLVQYPRPDRDESELLLARVTEEDDVPLLGVCRGMQVMAVAAGGALEQHLPDRLGNTSHAPGVGMYGTHLVHLLAGTRLRDILGEDVTVATYHHQGVSDAARYQVSARADDGVLEAFEDPSARFRIGVQWHPEAGDDPRLFEHLVRAAASG